MNPTQSSKSIRKRQEPIGNLTEQPNTIKRIKLFHNIDLNFNRKYSQDEVNQIHLYYRDILNKKEIELSNLLTQLIELKKEYLYTFTSDCSYIS